MYNHNKYSMWILIPDLLIIDLHHNTLKMHTYSFNMQYFMSNLFAHDW